MAESKHSPGPWEVRPEHNEVVGIDSGNCKVLRAVVYGSTEEEIEANTRLIAAAPELLEIAAEALNWWHADDSNFDKREPEFIRLAHKSEIAREAAIAKARGE